MKCLILILCSILLVAGQCAAETIIVDQNGFADFNNIQDAIDYSWDGDTIIVNPGIYPEDIFFNSRAVTVTSEDPDDPNTVKATIINGTITFDFGEQEDSILRGFTVASKYELAICTHSSSFSDIYGDTVVWQDNRNGSVNSDIYGYNLTTQQEFPICTAMNIQSSPAIYNNIVVWEDWTNYDIYGYNLTTKQEFPIHTTSGSHQPDIYSNTVVWNDRRNGSGNSDIYGYDLVTEQEFAVCTAIDDQSMPAIYGNIVVWQDNRNGSGNSPDIYGYDLTTQQEFLICTAAGSQCCPDIYGNIVVWHDYRNGNSDIYGYDLVAKQEFPICTEAGSQVYPAIYGNTVVWEDERSGNSDIYGYDLVTEQEFAICTAIGSQTRPIIYGNIVVWNYNLNIYATTQIHIPRVINTGVVCYDSFPTLTQNQFLGFQTALDCNANAMPRVQDNTFLNNTTAIVNCHSTISGNSFVNNNVAMQDCNSSIINNRLAGNPTPLLRCTGNIADNNVVGAVTALSTCTGMISRNSIEATTTALANCTGTISDNNISSPIGLSGCIGTIVGNTISDATTGLANCTGSIDRNVVVQGTTAMSGCSGQIQGNTVSLNTNGFINCNATFLNNLVTANAKGFQSCGGTISNNTITGSKEYALYQNSAAVKNNIIAFNQVGIYGVCSNSYNCFWSNTGGNFANGAYAKTGDFFGNPRFARDGVWIGYIWQEGDYHLKSGAGRYDPNNEIWVLDDVNSPCIDAGDPCDPIGYEPNPNGGKINVGNYGGTWEASKSTNGSGPEPPLRCLEYPAMDFNKDCKVDFQDFAIFCQSWLECNLDPPSACLE